MNESCGSCRFFQLQNAANGSGVCRRFPPAVVMQSWMTQRPTMLTAMASANIPQDATISQVQNIAGQFPPMMVDGWCGEWRATA